MSSPPREIACQLVRVPGGSFLMGDASSHGYSQERPAHPVYVDSFWAGKYCVTVREYFAFVEDMGDDFQELWCDFINPCFILKQGDRYQVWEGAEDYPMIQVSFVGAVAYCNWLSRKMGLEPVYELDSLEADLSKNGVRLLKEAEWEYACGGPDQYEFGYANAFDPERVCYQHYAGEFRERRASHRRIGGFGLTDYAPLPVGTLPPNAFGLCEMLGNVNEWCHDRYAPYGTDAQRNPAGAPTGSFRVIRGGCFLDESDKLRKSYRHAIHHQSKCMIDGFRIGRNG